MPSLRNVVNARELSRASSAAVCLVFRGRKISGLADLPSSLKKLSDEQLGWGRGYTAIRHTTQPLHRELHKSCGRPTSTPDRADTPPIGSSNNLTWADRLPTGSAARHRCDKRNH